MTYLRGGSDHSALARSNERAARQERSVNAIDTKHGGENTFNGVVAYLRRNYRLSCKNGVYTVKLHAGIRNAALALLESVNAVVVSYHFASDTISFKEYKPHVWTLDPLLMLPAVTAPANVLGKHPSLDGFTAVVIGTTSTGIQIEYTKRGQLWSAPKKVRSEIPHIDAAMYKFTPRCRAYTMPGGLTFEQKLELKKERDAAKREARDRAIREGNQRAAHALAEMERLERERNAPEITGDMVQTVATEQAKVTKRHNALEYYVIGQAPSGGLVKVLKDLPV